jgi:hypothetical protein
MMLQPRKIFTTTTDPTLGGWRVTAMIVGRKYNKRTNTTINGAGTPALTLDSAMVISDSFSRLGQRGPAS